MARYSFETSPNEDRPGVQVWIVRDGKNYASLACCQNELDPFDDGIPVPDSIVRKAEKFAETVDY